MSAIFQKLGAGQPEFTTEVQQGDYEIAFSFGARDPTAIEVSAGFMQLANSYTRPAASSNISVASPQNVANTVTAYFVDDTDVQDLRGGLRSWRRQWATIPATWSEPGGTYAFTFPGYTGATAFGNVFAATAIVANGTGYTVNTNATGISAADDTYLDLNYVRSSANYHVTFHTPAIAATSGTDVTIAGILPGSSVFTDVTGTVRKGDASRGAAETLEVDSILLHDYVLSSEAAVDVDLPQIQKFSPTSYGFGSTGAEVQFLTATTVPTTSQYTSMINAGTLIVAAPSERRKYAGNIYERITRLVAAR